ncbi:MAG: FecR family protein [Chitinophagaceae bacterium]|nr:FecR family protein [Chitinophagaceae bacterium]
MISKIKLLIAKFWENKLSSEESSELDHLLEFKDIEFKTELERAFEESISVKERRGLNFGERNVRIVSFNKVSYWWAAAAAIVVLFTGTILFKSKRQSVNDQSVSLTKSPTDSIDEVANVKNNSASNLLINLIDGTTVSLAPSSSLIYKKHFDKDARNIQLIGKALFKVAKDKSRPFSVITGEYATTALGTQFEVNALGKEKIVVKLFEGKVKVYSIQQSNLFATVFLTAGQSVTVNKFSKTKNATTTNIVQKKKNEKTEKQNSSLKFDHESLKVVFEKLSAAYNVKILYDSAEIEGLYFTGYTLESDTIKNIIALIVNMNGLKVMDEGDQIRIVKK